MEAGAGTHEWKIARVDDDCFMGQAWHGDFMEVQVPDQDGYEGFTPVAKHWRAGCGSETAAIARDHPPISPVADLMRMLAARFRLWTIT